MPRIKCLNNFKRKTESRKFRRKIFFVFEGIKTEVIYVKELVKNLEQNNYFYYLYRGKKDKQSNNLFKLSNEIVQIINLENNISLICEDLIEVILDVCEKNNIELKVEYLEEEIASFIKENKKKSRDEIKDNEMESHNVHIENALLKSDCKVLIDINEFMNLIKKHTSYEKEVDKIILIGDRDRGSFTCEQYNNVLKQSLENDFLFIITNPCIEFWFLLHHTNASEIDTSDWNSIMDASKKALFELKKLDSNYTKTKFNASSYVEKTKVALKNINNFATDIKSLENNVGSNMGDLLSEIEFL